MIHLLRTVSMAKDTSYKTNPFNTIGCKPVKRLDEKEKSEHEGKQNVEVVTKDSKR